MKLIFFGILFLDQLRELFMYMFNHRSSFFPPVLRPFQQLLLIEFKFQRVYFEIGFLKHS